MGGQRLKARFLMCVTPPIHRGPPFGLWIQHTFKYYPDAFIVIAVLTS